MKCKQCGYAYVDEHNEMRCSLNDDALIDEDNSCDSDAYFSIYKPPVNSQRLSHK